MNWIVGGAVAVAVLALVGRALARDRVPPEVKLQEAISELGGRKTVSVFGDVQNGARTLWDEATTLLGAPVTGVSQEDVDNGRVRR